MERSFGIGYAVARTQLFLDRPVREFISPSVVELIERKLAAALKSGSMQTFDYELTFTPGDTRKRSKALSRRMQHLRPAQKQSRLFRSRKSRHFVVVW